MSLLHWLQDSGLGQYLESSAWANLVLLCFHALGMSVVVGILWILDLRVLGFARSLPLSAFRPLVRLAWLGFIVNAASGLLLFAGAATRFIINTDFQLKMLLMVLGGLSVLALRACLREAWREGSATADCAANAEFSAAARIAAALSLLLWSGVILFGRQIAYTLARPAA
jgi:hypothetical protein